MRNAIAFGACVALFAPILCAQRQETGLVIQSWKYDPDTKQLALTLVNLSDQDIIAYNVSDSVPGSTDLYGRPQSPGEHLEDSLGVLINEQMTGQKPPKDYPGVFAAGASRTLNLWAKDISVKAVVDLVVYADATAEVLNEHAFSQVVANPHRPTDGHEEGERGRPSRVGGWCDHQPQRGSG